MQKDLTENTEFRIKWPRGQLGSLPADSEQFAMIEDLYKTTDKLNAHIESMALNKVNTSFKRKQMDKVLVDIEKLKDQNENEIYTNGSGIIHSKVESVIALLMFVVKIKEARIQKAAACLRGKRQAERQYSESVRYQCWTGSAELED